MAHIRKLCSYDVYFKRLLLTQFNFQGGKLSGGRNLFYRCYLSNVTK
jgi:hypothetical protein